MWECLRECRASEIRLCVCKDEQIQKICNEGKIQLNGFTYFSLWHLEYDTHHKDRRSSLLQKCWHMRWSWKNLLKPDKRKNNHHNKCYYCRQYMLHVSVITYHPQALNTRYLKQKINCLNIEFLRSHKFYVTHIYIHTRALRARGSAVVWGTALQAGRARVRLAMVSEAFFIDIILPAALWPWGWLSL